MIMVRIKFIGRPGNLNKH